jgi:uncharacterized protein (DUF1778 family)
MASPAAARSNRKPKTDRIDVRIPRETKRVIERAAALIGTTTSDFITMQAYEAAQRVIEGQGRWVLDDAQSKAFVEALINPPEPNAALKAAAKRYKALVRSDVG